MKKISTSVLVDFLRSKEAANTKFTDKLKIRYRPYICPFDQLLIQIPTGKSVFDVGCGSGQFALLLAEFREPTRLKGIEISQTLVDNAKALLAPYSSSVFVDFAKYHGDDIPDDIAQYDYVTMIDVAHHIPAKLQHAFFEQLYAKMATGSVLVFKDINASSPFVYANKMHDLLFAGELGNEKSFSYTKELFNKLGLTILSSSKKLMFCYPHFTIIAKK